MHEIAQIITVAISVAGCCSVDSSHPVALDRHDLGPRGDEGWDPWLADVLSVLGPMHVTVCTIKTIYYFSDESWVNITRLLASKVAENNRKWKQDRQNNVQILIEVVFSNPKFGEKCGSGVVVSLLTMLKLTATIVGEDWFMIIYFLCSYAGALVNEYFFAYHVLEFFVIVQVGRSFCGFCVSVF